MFQFPHFHVLLTEICPYVGRHIVKHIFGWNSDMKREQLGLVTFWCDYRQDRRPDGVYMVLPHVGRHFSMFFLKMLNR